MEFNQEMVAIFLLSIVTIILFVTGKINSTVLIIMLGLIALFYLKSTRQRVKISLKEAEAIGKSVIKELQRDNRITLGQLTMLPNSGLHKIIFSNGNEAEIVADRYDIYFSIDSSSGVEYFLIKIGLYGDVEGYVPIEETTMKKKLGQEYLKIKGITPRDVEIPSILQPKTVEVTEESEIYEKLKK